MSDSVEKMNFKELRKEVRFLRDELAVFKRKYEDAIYNLDSGNFGKSFTLEQNNMKTQIKLTANALKSTVSKTELEAELKKYSSIEQTAELITATVDAEYVDTLIGDTYVTNAALSSELKLSADGIFSTVSAIYETKKDAENEYSALSSSVSSIQQSSSRISTRVSNLETFKESTFTQTADGFTLDGDKTTFTGVIHLTDNDGATKFSIFYDDGSNGWEQVIMSGYAASIPIVLGDAAGDVYIGNYANGNQVATRSWVEANSGSGSGTAVAVFG